MPGPVCAQTNAAMAAMKISTIMPAAPTSTRFQRSRKLQRRRRVHIRHRRENHQHHAHHVDFAAEPPAKIGMAEFVERLDQDQAEVEQEQVVRRQQSLPCTRNAPKLSGPMFNPKPTTSSQSSAPNGLINLPHHRQRANQKTVRIEQRKPHEHDVQELEADFALPAFLVTLEQLRAVGGQVVLQQVGEIKLRKQLNDRFLARARRRENGPGTAARLPPPCGQGAAARRIHTPPGRSRKYWLLNGFSSTIQRSPRKFCRRTLTTGRRQIF